MFEEVEKGEITIDVPTILERSMCVVLEVLRKKMCTQLKYFKNINGLVPGWGAPWAGTLVLPYTVLILTRPKHACVQVHTVPVIGY